MESLIFIPLEFTVKHPDLGGDSHIKVTGMLFISLWGVKSKFWSHLGCLEWNVKSLYLPIQVSLSNVCKEINK